MSLLVKVVIGATILGIIVFLLFHFNIVKLDSKNSQLTSLTEVSPRIKEEPNLTQEEEQINQIIRDNNLIKVTEVSGAINPSKSREIICRTNLSYSLEDKNNPKKFEKVLFDLSEHPYLWVDKGSECFKNLPDLVLSFFKSGYQWLNKSLILVPYKEDLRPDIAKKLDLIEIQSVLTYKKQSNMDRLYCKSNLMLVNLGSRTPGYEEKSYEKVIYDAYYFISTWVSKDTICSSNKTDYQKWWNSGYSELSSGGELTNINKYNNSNQINSDDRPEKARENDMMKIEDVKGYYNVGEMDRLYCAASKLYVPNATTGKEVISEIYFDAFYYPGTWVTKDAACGSGKNFYKKYKDKGFKFLSSGGEIG